MKRRKKAVAAPTDSEDSAPARRLARKPEAENEAPFSLKATSFLTRKHFKGSFFLSWNTLKAVFLKLTHFKGSFS